jgi:hypothetical protein
MRYSLLTREVIKRGVTDVAGAQFILPFSYLSWQAHGLAMAGIDYYRTVRVDIIQRSASTTRARRGKGTRLTSRMSIMGVMFHLL